MNRTCAVLAACLLLAPAPIAAQSAPIVIDEMPSDVASRTEAQLERIRTLDDAGPMLNAVIAYDLAAVRVAIANTERSLEGRTVLVKDNIETR